jgi:hypothetical protein
MVGSVGVAGLAYQVANYFSAENINNEQKLNEYVMKIIEKLEGKRKTFPKAIMSIKHLYNRVLYMPVPDDNDDRNFYANYYVKNMKYSRGGDQEGLHVNAVRMGRGYPRYDLIAKNIDNDVKFALSELEKRGDLGESLPDDTDAKANSGDPAKTSKQPQHSQRPYSDPTERMRGLLSGLNIDPGTGTGWTPKLNEAFKEAYNRWKAHSGNTNAPNINNDWKIIAQQLGLSGDIKGATQLVGRLVALERPDASPAPAAAPAPQSTAPPETPAAVDKVDVVNGLESLFAQILSRQVKVDQEGADMRRDSKDFRGVIEGLGGARSAASYCVEKCNFNLDENKEIIAYKDQPLEALANKIDRSAVLSKIYRLFTDIRKQSRRPFRRGITQRGLAANVQAWLQGQRQAKEASISKSIEIRKTAARKKLGLQS